MDAWEAGRDLALVKEAEEAAQEDAWGTQHNWKFELKWWSENATPCSRVIGCALLCA